MSQRDRLLRRLERGPVPATDFAAPNVIDGGKPIFRVAARVGELRDAGYEILTTRAPSGVAVYHLVCDTGVAGGDDRDVPEHSGGPTDPAEPATTHPLGGGHHLVHATVAATARVNGPTDSPPPSVGGQLFDPADLAETNTPRPHYLEAAA